MKYRVEFTKWIAGQGVSYTETIDNIDIEPAEAQRYADGYAADYAGGNDGSWVEIIDSDTDEIVAKAEIDEDH